MRSMRLKSKVMTHDYRRQKGKQETLPGAVNAMASRSKRPADSKRCEVLG